MVTERHTHCEIHPPRRGHEAPSDVLFTITQPWCTSRVRACAEVCQFKPANGHRVNLVGIFTESNLTVVCGCRGRLGLEPEAAVIMNVVRRTGFCQSTCFRTLVFDDGRNGHFCNPPGRLVHLRNDAVTIWPSTGCLWWGRRA
jgi:hypothetical protein